MRRPPAGGDQRLPVRRRAEPRQRPGHPVHAADAAGDHRACAAGDRRRPHAGHRQDAAGHGAGNDRRRGNVSSESIPSKENDDEWRKKITSILLAASPFVLLDNIPDNTTIDSPSLAAALTTEQWSDRLLGRNNAIRLPSRVVWAATGNNLRVAGDMPRRSYSIRLDANAERPWERTGFKIKGWNGISTSGVAICSRRR